jgi:serine/threonine protein kinase
MSNSIPERLGTPFDSGRIDTSPKKAGIYAYHTVWDKIKEKVFSILCPSRLLYVSGLNRSKPEELHCVSRASLLKFLDREGVKEYSTFTESQLQDIVQDLHVKSEETPKEATSFKKAINSLLSKAVESKSHLTKPLAGETFFTRQYRQDSLKKCKDTIDWCNTQLEETQHLGRHTIEILIGKVKNPPENLFDKTGLQQRENDLSLRTTASENIASLVQYAQSIRSPLPEGDLKDPQVFFQWFQERAKANQPPPATASTFIKNLFNISKAFSDQKAKIELLYANPDLILPLKKGALGKLDTLFSQNIQQLPTIESFDSSTETQRAEKIRLFNAAAEEKINGLMEYSATKHQEKHAELGLRDPPAPRGGYTTTDQYLTAVASENQYKLINIPATDPPALQDLKNKYNKIALAELSRVLPTLGLKASTAPPGAVYSTLEEYLASVAAENQYALSDTPTTDPNLQALQNTYNDIARTVLPNFLQTAGLKKFTLHPRHSYPTLDDYLTAVASKNQYKLINTPTTDPNLQALQNTYNDIARTVLSRVLPTLGLKAPTVPLGGVYITLDEYLSAVASENQYALSDTPTTDPAVRDLKNKYNKIASTELSRVLQSEGLNTPPVPLGGVYNTAEEYLATVASENQYKLINIPATDPPALQDLKNKYNKIALTELSRVLPTLGLNTPPVRPGVVYSTLDEYLAAVASESQYTLNLSAPPTTDPNLQALEYKYCEIARTVLPNFLRAAGLQTTTVRPRYSFPTLDEYLTAVASKNQYKLINTPTTDPNLQALQKKYNDIARTELSRVLQTLGLNTTKVPPGGVYNTTEEYLAAVALANKYATIRAPNPALQPLIDKYNQNAIAQRDLWLSQPCFATMPRMIKITKNNLEKVLPYTSQRQLGTGSSKVAFSVEISKPTQTAKKMKVLAEANLSGIPGPVEQAAKIKTVNDEITSEAQISDELRHLGVPHLAFVRGVTTTEPGNKVYAYMDFCDVGTLEDLAKVRPVSTLKDKVTMAVELSQALAGMHGANYCHGDMKTLNVLVQWSPPDTSGIRHPHAKLSDFGLTSKFGTPGFGQATYIPPEIMRERMADRTDLPSNPAGDLWVLGNLLYRLKRGQSLLDSPGGGGIRLSWDSLRDPVEFQASMTAVLRRSRDLRTPGNDAMDVLIGELFQEDPAQRPTAAQVVTRLQAFLGTL